MQNHYAEIRTLVLSQKRADNVMQFMISQGVRPSLVSEQDSKECMGRTRRPDRIVRTVYGGHSRSGFPVRTRECRPPAFLVCPLRATQNEASRCGNADHHRRGQRTTRKVDSALLKGLAPASVWFDELASGWVHSLAEIARNEGIAKRYVAHPLVARLDKSHKSWIGV